MFLYPSPAQLASAVGADTPLNSTQVELVKAEMADPTGRGYANASGNAAKVGLLISPYTAAIGAAGTPNVPMTRTVASSDLYNQLVFAKDVSGNPLAATLHVLSQGSTPLAGASALILGSIQSMPSINFGESAVYGLIQEWTTAMVAGGVITQDTANTFLYDTQHPSRLDEILGTTGAVLTVTEFAAAIA